MYKGLLIQRSITDDHGGKMLYGISNSLRDHNSRVYGFNIS